MPAPVVDDVLHVRHPLQRLPVQGGRYPSMDVGYVGVGWWRLWGWRRWWCFTPCRRGWDWQRGDVLGWSWGFLIVALFLLCRKLRRLGNFFTQRIGRQRKTISFPERPGLIFRMDPILLFVSRALSGTSCPRPCRPGFLLCCRTSSPITQFLLSFLPTHSCLLLSLPLFQFCRMKVVDVCSDLIDHVRHVVHPCHEVIDVSKR